MSTEEEKAAALKNFELFLEQEKRIKEIKERASNVNGECLDTRVWMQVKQLM